MRHHGHLRTRAHLAPQHAIRRGHGSEIRPSPAGGSRACPCSGGWSSTLPPVTLLHSECRPIPVTLLLVTRLVVYGSGTPARAGGYRGYMRSPSPPVIVEWAYRGVPSAGYALRSPSPPSIVASLYLLSTQCTLKNDTGAARSPVCVGGPPKDGAHQDPPGGPPRQGSGLPTSPDPQRMARFPANPARRAPRIRPRGRPHAFGLPLPLGKSGPLHPSQLATTKKNDYSEQTTRTSLNGVTPTRRLHTFCPNLAFCPARILHVLSGLLRFPRHHHPTLAAVSPWLARLRGSSSRRPPRSSLASRAASASSGRSAHATSCAASRGYDPYRTTTAVAGMPPPSPGANRPGSSSTSGCTPSSPTTTWPPTGSTWRTGSKSAFPSSTTTSSAPEHPSSRPSHRPPPRKAPDPRGHAPPTSRTWCTTGSSARSWRRRRSARKGRCTTSCRTREGVPGIVGGIPEGEENRGGSRGPDSRLESGSENPNRRPPR